jgi:nickel transport protein
VNTRACQIHNFLLAALACLALPGQADAHGAGHVPVDRVLDQPGIAVEFRLSDGEAMAHASYRLLAPDAGATVFQNGRTDALGRLAFVPDRPGNWRVEVEDVRGHKAAATVEILDGATVAEQPAWRRWLLRGSVLLNLALLSLLLHVGLSFWRRPRLTQRVTPPLTAATGERN